MTRGPWIRRGRLQPNRSGCPAIIRLFSVPAAGNTGGLSTFAAQIACAGDIIYCNAIFKMLPCKLNRCFWHLVYLFVFPTERHTSCKERPCPNVENCFDPRPVQPSRALHGSHRSLADPQRPDFRAQRRSALLRTLTENTPETQQFLRFPESFPAPPQPGPGISGAFFRPEPELSQRLYENIGASRRLNRLRSGISHTKILTGDARHKQRRTLGGHRDG